MKWRSVNCLQMKSHACAPQATGNPKVGSSFVLLRGCEGDDYVPYHISSRTKFTMEASDRNIVGLLRMWASSHPIDTRMFTSWPFSAMLFSFVNVNVTAMYESVSMPVKRRCPSSHLLQTALIGNIPVMSASVTTKFWKCWATPAWRMLHVDSCRDYQVHEAD